MWKIDPARLRAAMSRAMVNQSQLAEAIGLKQPSIGRLLSGETKTTRSLEQIARVLDTTPAYLKGETARPEIPEADAERVSIDIPQVDLADIGVPFNVSAQRDDRAQVPFPRVWLEPIVAKSFSDLFLTHSDDDLMMPTLLDGDRALVDTGQRELVQQDRLWCLGYGGLAMIRRVRRMPDGALRIIADNPSTPPISAQADECNLIGRVIWIGRQS